MKVLQSVLKNIIISGTGEGAAGLEYRNRAEVVLSHRHLPLHVMDGGVNSNSDAKNGGDGENGTGGGGGGGGGDTGSRIGRGGNGGSGVVIIRCKHIPRGTRLVIR